MYIIRYEQFTKCLHFSLEKKVNELFTHCTENSKIILIWKISRNFQDNIICNRKFIQNIFCLLEVVGVSFQTKLPTLFSIDYCKWICFMNVLSFSIQTNLWNGQGEFLLIKWKRTCGLGVVNTSRHTSHPWSSMFPYGLCPSGIAHVLIIKHSKNGSCEAVDKGSIDLGDTATHYLFQGKQDSFRTENTF